VRYEEMMRLVGLLILGMAMYFTGVGLHITYLKYKDNNWHTYHPTRAPKNDAEQALYSASNVAKKMVARAILMSSPREAFHDDAIRLMPCFTDVEFAYDVDRDEGHAAHVEQHRLRPYTRRIWFLKSFFTLPKLEQASVVIHECSHIYCGTDDNAYNGENHFASLHEEEQRANADSVVAYITRGRTLT